MGEKDEDMDRESITCRAVLWNPGAKGGLGAGWGPVLPADGPGGAVCAQLPLGAAGHPVAICDEQQVLMCW